MMMCAGPPPWPGAARPVRHRHGTREAGLLGVSALRGRPACQEFFALRCAYMQWQCNCPSQARMGRW